MEGGTETPDRDVYLELRVSGILRTCKTHSRVSRVIQHLPVLKHYQLLRSTLTWRKSKALKKRFRSCVEDQDQSERKSSTASKLLRLQVSQILFFLAHKHEISLQYTLTRCLIRTARTLWPPQQRSCVGTTPNGSSTSWLCWQRIAWRFWDWNPKCRFFCLLFLSFVGLIEIWSQIWLNTFKRLGIASNATDNLILQDELFNFHAAAYRLGFSILIGFLTCIRVSSDFRCSLFYKRQHSLLISCTHRMN